MTVSYVKITFSVLGAFFPSINFAFEVQSKRVTIGKANDSAVKSYDRRRSQPSAEGQELENNNVKMWP